jgi:hypothetical protein
MLKYTLLLAVALTLMGCDDGPTFKVARTRIAESLYIKIQSTNQGAIRIKQIIPNQRPQCVVDLIGPNPMSFGDVIHAVSNPYCSEVIRVGILTDHGSSNF